MNYQLGRTLQETHTTLTPAEVLDAAKRFFARRQGIYAAFVEKEGPTYVNLRGQGGEELIVGVLPAENGTRVTASTYIFDQQVGRFFATLPPYPAEDRADGAHDAGGTATPEAPGHATPGGPA